MRNYQIDNYKVFLTFLVVLGHVLVFMRTPSLVYPINVIYSFHMPAFIFLNGVLFKAINFKKVSKLLITFVFMQCFYLFYMDLIGYSSASILERLLNPVFHIWYLLAYIVWMLITAVLEWIKNHYERYIFWSLIMLVLVLSLLIRFVNSSLPDQFLTYTRIFVFLPFFLIGFYSKNVITHISTNTTEQTRVCSIIGIVTIFTSILGLTYMGVLKNTALFFGFQHIQNLPYKPLTFLTLELYQLVVGILLLIFMFILMPDAKYKWTALSSNVTFIYLWHPALVVLLIHKSWINYSVWMNLTIAILLSLAVMLVLHLFQNRIKIQMNKKW